MTTTTATPPLKAQPTSRNKLAAVASVRLTILLLVALGATILAGAWVPQEPAVGWSKVLDWCGPSNAGILRCCGLTDVFHSLWLVSIIALLTVNLVACSVERTLPKLKAAFQPQGLLTACKIANQPIFRTLELPAAPEVLLQQLTKQLKSAGYKVILTDRQLAAERGKISLLAPAVTHIGLLILLLAVSISSLTGFSGFKETSPGGSLTFNSSEHSRLWFGKLPTWHVRCDSTRQVNYPTGEPKQWLSKLTIVDSSGKTLRTKEIAVNNPLSHAGVDIYQSGWGLGELIVNLDSRALSLDLKQVGSTYVALLPIAQGFHLIFALSGQDAPLQIFADLPRLSSPRLITAIARGGTVRLGSVKLVYKDVIPVTGLQYKSDPGYLLVLLSFFFITAGTTLAAMPHRQLWAASDPARTTSLSSSSILSIGATSLKGQRSFAGDLAKIIASIEQDTARQENV